MNLLNPATTYGDGSSHDGRLATKLHLYRWNQVAGSTAGTAWLMDEVSLEHVGYVAYNLTRRKWMGVLALDPICGARCYKETRGEAAAWLLAEVRALRQPRP